MKLFIEFDRAFDFFLAKDQQGHGINYVLDRRACVKDIIESLGVPHTEIGHLYFDHQKIDFSFVPVSQGRLRVKAIDPPLAVLSPSFLRPIPLECIKFIADVNVIRLGRLLILSGFDVDYSPVYSDEKIANIASREDRIVLTRDTGLLKRKKIVFARRIKASRPYDQLVETIDFFGLKNLISFFSRCTQCNARLVPTDKKEVMHLLEPKTKRYFDTFFQCPVCQRVFWKGSHYENIQKKMVFLGISTGQ